MPENNKSFRIPMTETQQSVLSEMLGHVPSRKVVQYDWTSESGRAFIKAVRNVQVTGVPLPWIAEILDVSPGSLAGAIDYWERSAPRRPSTRTTRRREKRPLRKATDGEA